ncbi:MAG: ABC transporter ATP-binding protein [Desulfobacterales bacterium]|nr:ABC transporter ATP-binding protein [Desulfobacterales bacterium]
MLELKDIKKSYKIGPIELEVLKGISLFIDKGELLSIMGPSGCGKSTLMNIIGLLDKPTSGSYLISNNQISYTDDDKLSNFRNRKIGFVFQNYHLLPKLNALDNVSIPLIYRGDKKQERRRKSLDFLKKVDMHTRAYHRPSELSGGQQQRVAIARALVGNPSIILADEPTGALDTKIGEEIMNLFKKLNKEESITIIIITHDPNIAKECSRVVYMKDGLIHDHKI